MKLVHEAVIERGKIFEAFGAGFFETFEEEDLCAGVYLFQELTQLSHGVTAGWDTKDIVHKALDELLSEILTGEVALREFPRSQKLVERYGLRSKWDCWLLARGHADGTPARDTGTSVCGNNFTGPPWGASSAQKERPRPEPKDR